MTINWPLIIAKNNSHYNTDPSHVIVPISVLDFKNIHTHTCIRMTSWTLMDILCVSFG